MTTLEIDGTPALQARKVEKPKLPSLHALARQMLEKADGDVDKTRDLMLKSIHRDPAIYRAVVGPMCDKAIDLYIGLARNSQRNILEKIEGARRAIDNGTAGQGDAKMTPEEKKAHDYRRYLDGLGKVKSTLGVSAAVTALSAYDFPLPHGVKLGDATRSDLKKAAEYWRKSGNTMLRRALTADAIHDLIPTDGVPVRAVFKEHEIAPNWHLEEV
jgi:hypothetical protein